jgi:hypothetical protein
MAKWSVTVRYVMTSGTSNSTTISVEAMSERTAMVLAQNQIKAKASVKSAEAVRIRMTQK